MGLLDIISPKRRRAAAALREGSYFKSFTEYAPQFTTWKGGVYEQALTRAAVERFAVGCSKLKPECLGTGKRNVRRLFETAPNSYMSWPKFLARCATILETDTTCAIVPSLDQNLSVTGLFPLKFDTAEIVDYENTSWIRFTLSSGDQYAIELERVCLLTRFQYQSDFFGGGNNPLTPVMALIDAQDQAQEFAIRNGANIRFVGKLTGMVHEDDMEKKRERFSQTNLAQSNTSGLLLYDSTFSDLKQVNEQHYTISAEEMETINQSVYTYFGINQNILQNDYTEDTWGAYYEGKIEPFAVQLGEGLTQMLFTERERKAGNVVMFSSNRLEYASNASKRNMVRDMTDRGLMSINEGREVLQLPPIEGGDVRIVRGEYMDASMLENVISLSKIPISKDTDEDFDLGGDDDIYNDTDSAGMLEED